MKLQQKTLKINGKAHPATKAKSVRRIRVGQKVLVRFGVSTIKASVVEDRGFIGVGGRQIVAVRLPAASQWEEPRIIEVPAEEARVTK